MRVATPYGAFELKRAYQKNLGLAIFIAVLVHFILIGSFLFFSQIKAQKPGPKIVIIIDDPIKFGPPPSLTKTQAQQVVVKPQVKSTLPSTGIPEAVRDDQVKEEINYATQDELQRALQNPILIPEGTDEDESLIVQFREEYLPPPDKFIPTDELPASIKLVKPSYPDLAKRAGVEGLVWVEALVDKHGKVRDVKCIKGPGSVNQDIFCEAATKAAMQNEYKPAISNKEPVAVWVQYKVEFTLK
jgi:protein TonB